MKLKETIRRILREENEKTPKSKLLKTLNKPNGLVKLLNWGFTIEAICDIMEMSEKELYQEYLLKNKSVSLKNTNE